MSHRITGEHLNDPEVDTFFLEIKHFLNCISTDEEPLTNGRSQRRPLELVTAAYQSIQRGQPVNTS